MRKGELTSVTKEVVFVIFIFFITILAIVQTIRVGVKSRKVNRQALIIQEYKDKYDEKQIENYEKRISELEEEIKTKIDLQKQSEVGMTEDSTYLNRKFPSDGKYYKDTESVIFYSDPSCTVKIFDELRFMSCYIDSAKAENGLDIYCLRMDNGRICYCTTHPNLVTEKEYNKMKSQ